MADNGENKEEEEVEMSEESEIIDDYDAIVDVSDIDDVDTNVDDLNDVDQLLVTTKEESNKERKQTNEEEKERERRLFQPRQVSREEVVDDFIRNFLIEQTMNRTLEMFQGEFYELSQKGKVQYDSLQQVPDIYMKNEKLKENILYLKKELKKANKKADKHKDTFERLRKERDFHKIHHNRVQGEKGILMGNLDKLNGLHVQYDKKYEELMKKYERAMKEKMLLKLEKEKLVKSNANLEIRKKELEDKITKEFGETDEEIKSRSRSEQLNRSKSKSVTKSKYTPYPLNNRDNPFNDLKFEVYNSKNLQCTKYFKGHTNAITAMSMHPKKSIIATASDDMTWQIRTLPHGELIMSGEGHKDWVANVDFHPKGSHLATCSGDSTIKIWDFLKAACVATFDSHIHPVWAVSWHDMGSFCVSGSMDSTCKLFDVPCEKMRQTFRGHTDSVNDVQFSRFSNVFASAGADKTISLWDMRAGLLLKTFYGHLNAVNHIDFSLDGNQLCSCDSDGIVKVWDIRNVEELYCFNACPETEKTYSANSCCFDKSAKIIAVACEDHVIRIFNENEGNESSPENEMSSDHKDIVHDIKFDFNSKMLVSCGADNTVRVFQ